MNRTGSVNIKIPSDINARIRVIAIQDGTSVSAARDEALRIGVEAMESRGRKSRGRKARGRKSRG